MNLRSLETGLPLILWSHIISFINPMASVVLASSKNTTVSRSSFRFSFDFSSACWMNLLISSSVVPPCTYVSHTKNQWKWKFHICYYIYLQYQHVLNFFVLPLPGQITHVAYQPCLATPSLTHYHHRNTTSRKMANNNFMELLITFSYTHLNLIWIARIFMTLS